MKQEEQKEYRKKQMAKGWALIFAFAVAVMGIITFIWNVTGRPVLELITPVLAMIVLAVSLLSFFLGVMVAPAVKKARKEAEEKVRAETEAGNNEDETTEEAPGPALSIG